MRDIDLLGNRAPKNNIYVNVKCPKVIFKIPNLFMSTVLSLTNVIKNVSFDSSLSLEANIKLN